MLIATNSEDFIRAETERRRRKEIERSAEDRILDPWERYRALTDHCDRLLDVTDIYERKTRFALLILGGLNAINLAVVTRADVLGAVSADLVWLGAYVIVYALLSLALLGYAIAALRPRAPQAMMFSGERAFGTADEYCNRWQQVQVGALNRALATSAYAVAQANGAKVRALCRVYTGLSVLAVLTAGPILAIAFTRWFAFGP